MSERRKSGLAFGALLLAVTLLYSDVLFLGTSFYRVDAFQFHYPTKYVVRAIVSAGEFPFWNPFYSAGQPLAANPNYGLFYPPQWLTWFGDFYAGFRLHILFHFYLAVSGMYLLMRALRMSIIAASLGALSFVLSGYLQSLTGLFPYLFALAWFPWIVFFAHRYFEHRRHRDLSGAALTLAAVMIIGEPASILQACTFVVAYAIYRGSRTSDETAPIRRNLLAAVLMVVCAALAGAVQLVPTLLLGVDSVRARGFEYSHVVTWSLHPARVAELFFPHLFGHMDEHYRSYWGSRLYPITGKPFMFSLYAGQLLAVLAFATFVLRRATWKIAAACAFVWLIAAGGHTILFQILYDLGVVRSIRYPEKFAIISLFVLTIVGAKAFDVVVRGDRQLARVGTFIAGSLAGIALIWAVISSLDSYPAAFGRFWDLPEAAAALSAETSRLDWFIAFVRSATLAALLLIWTKPRSEKWRTLSMAGFVLFVVADLAPLANELAPRQPSTYFDEPAVTRALPPDRSSYRLFSEASLNWRSRDASHYHSFEELSYWARRNGLWPPLPNRWGFFTVFEPDHDRTHLLSTADLINALYAVQAAGVPWWRETFMNMSGARFTTVYRPFGDEMKRVSGDLTRLQPVDFVDVTNASRYYFAEEVIRIRDKEDFIRRIQERRPKARAAFVTENVAMSATNGSIRVIGEQANETSLSVHTSGAAFLVLSITRHRFWRATIDGRPAPVVPTNLAYQGLRIPPGQHEVRVTFFDPVVVICLAVSAMAVTILLVIFFRGLRVQSEPRG